MMGGAGHVVLDACSRVTRESDLNLVALLAL